ncbi:hypothetical protein EDB81DRAFT_760878 [Dactylonectria macrodidyma]|uniref:Uncharacterized protein n=1 Tax=Dactylonectria macrodidyma TaxID=307937 RepID=A0A9P9EQZ7_9HYPO|nr:hypothetical protein EDB81DRAFT_760878 [Dactylonectria macrodidyma]
MLSSHETEAKGHSVRAIYYYAAATDLVRLSPKDDANSQSLQTALKRLWRDTVDKKMYITGGLRSVTQWEGFGSAYLLPNLESDSCYAETCATLRSSTGAIACCAWSLIQNTQMSWRSLFTMDSLEQSTNELKIPGTDIVVSQKTGMPWSGVVTLSVSQGKTKSGYLHVPTDSDTEIHLTFSMILRKVYAHPSTDKHSAYLMRGALVYCFEDVDNAGCDLDNFVLTEALVQDGQKVSVGGVTGVVTAHAEGRQLQRTENRSLYSDQPWVYEKENRILTAIPYLLWVIVVGMGNESLGTSNWIS